jgi:hypothetical protein
VDWYQFELDRAARVTLISFNPPGVKPPVSALSLYNSDPNDFNDLYDPLGYRLVAQDDSAAHAGFARIDRPLAPGIYHVAVSGSGNHYFHPFFAGSGTPGNTGDYGLLITAAILPLGPTDGPAVLTTDPAADAQLGRSPLMIRVDVSTALDPNAAVAGQTVQLISNPTGTFGNGKDQPIALAAVSLNTAGNELLVMPASALAPGFYRVILSGNTRTGQPVLARLNGTPLGANALHPTGADFAYSFQVTGFEGNSPSVGKADDTPVTAHRLGDLTKSQPVQITGSIGDDPFYDSTQSDPTLNPANDVDLYQFHISGPQRVAFIAETFAGRIGSPLDPALSLFQLGATDHRLHLLASNDNTLNNSKATNGTLPLYADATLYAGLTEGDYYLAVSSSGNVPDRNAGLLPGTNGIFDPNVSHSGQAGTTTGDYVLNLVVQPSGTAPKVVATTPQNGTTLNTPPTHVTVQFSKVVNLQQLAYQAAQLAQQNQRGNLDAVYIQGSDGAKYYPRFETYDNAMNQASFLLLDALRNGAYQMHFSGSRGLTDLAGLPLEGNDPTGDYVVSFTVQGPARGTKGNPLLWTDQEPNDDFTHAQVLGTLFPHELQSKVKVVRDFTADPKNAPSDTADYYQFQILQSRPYLFGLVGSGLPATGFFTLEDAAGKTIPTLAQGNGTLRLVSLDPGTYVIRIGGWLAANAARATYQLSITLGPSVENPTPLTIGPAPAYRIFLDNNPPPVSSPTVPSPVPPAPPPPTVSPDSPPVSPVVSVPPSTVPRPAQGETSPPPVSQSPAPPPSTSTTSLPPVNTPPAVVRPSAPPETSLATPVTSSQPVSAPANSIVSQLAPVVTLLVTPTVSVPTSLTPITSVSPASQAPSGAARSISTLTTQAASGAPVSNTPTPPAGPPVPASRQDTPQVLGSSSNAGIVPAVSQTPATVPSFAGIPPDVLAGLAVAPVGGVRGLAVSDTSLPSGPMQLRGGESAATDRSLRLQGSAQQPPERVVILEHTSSLRGRQAAPETPSQAVASRAEGPSSLGTDLVTLIKQSVRTAETTWARILNDLFMSKTWEWRLPDWFEQQATPRTTPDSALPGDARENAQDEAEGLEVAVPDPTSSVGASSCTTDASWAGMMLAWGVLKMHHDPAFRRESKQNLRLTRSTHHTRL